MKLIPNCRTTETEWRLDSQRKEIERLRTDKTSLVEMLNRTLEVLETFDDETRADSLHTRITALLAKVGP